MSKQKARKAGSNPAKNDKPKLFQVQLRLHAGNRARLDISMASVTRAFGANLRKWKIAQVKDESWYASAWLIQAE